MVLQYIGATTINSASVGASGQVRDGFSKRKSESDHAVDNDLQLSRPFRKTWRRVLLTSGMLEVQ